MAWLFQGKPATIPVMAWLMIVGGLVVLVSGAEALVRGAAWIAEALGIRPLVVGLTVVAIGTSAPELIICLIAANQGETGLVIGNIFGSNTANIALILGVTAIVQPISASNSRIRFEVFWLVAATALTFVAFINGEFSQQFGALLAALIVLFIVILVLRERRSHPIRSSKKPGNPSAKQALTHLVMTVGGGWLLYYGGETLVLGATTVAKELGMSPPVVGATVIAIGTSLPELAASILSARRGQPEMALGNIIGSNIFNILMVLGVTAIISPIPAQWSEHGTRILIPMILTLYLATLLLKSKRIAKPAGTILLISYISYIIWEIRQT